jgi:hypothetical protein
MSKSNASPSPHDVKTEPIATLATIRAPRRADQLERYSCPNCKSKTLAGPDEKGNFFCCTPRHVTKTEEEPDPRCWRGPLYQVLDDFESGHTPDPKAAMGVLARELRVHLGMLLSIDDVGVAATELARARAVIEGYPRWPEDLNLKEDLKPEARVRRWVHWAETWTPTSLSGGSASEAVVEDAVPPPPPKKRRNIPTAEANRIALDIARRYTKHTRNWSKTRWAAQIGCHLRTFKKTKFFEKLFGGSGSSSPCRPHAPRAVSFTEGVEANAAADTDTPLDELIEREEQEKKNREELEKTIREQKADDDDPRPLEPGPTRPKKPHRRKV